MWARPPTRRAQACVVVGRPGRASSEAKKKGAAYAAPVGWSWWTGLLLAACELERAADHFSEAAEV